MRPGFSRLGVAAGRGHGRAHPGQTLTASWPGA